MAWSHNFKLVSQLQGSVFGLAVEGHQTSALAGFTKELFQ